MISPLHPARFNPRVLRRLSPGLQGRADRQVAPELPLHGLAFSAILVLRGGGGGSFGVALWVLGESIFPE